MSENTEQIKVYLGQVIKNDFLPVLFARIDSHKQFLSEMSGLCGEYYALYSNLKIENDYNSIDEVIKLNKKILEKLDSRFHIDDDKVLLNELTAFDDSLNNFISESEETRIVPQAKERFYFQPGNSRYLRFLKFFKRRLYALSIVPLKVKNVFLKLFNRPINEINYWDHIILLRNLRSIYIKNSLYLTLSDLYIKTHSEQTTSLLVLKNYCVQAENNFREKHLRIGDPEFNPMPYNNAKMKFLEISKLLDELKNNFENKIDEIIAKIVGAYSDAYIKAGTIELSSNKLSSQNVAKSEKEFINLYNRIHKGWNNAIFALADDWRMDFELYKVRYQLILKFLSTLNIVNKKINDNVKPSITLINNAVSEIKVLFSSPEEKGFNIDELLSKSRKNLQFSLTENLIPKTIETILKQELLEQLDEVEETTEKTISELSNKRALVKTDLYDKEIKDSEISYISLQDMVSFSSLPKFKVIILKIKAEQSLKLQKIQTELLEIDQICDFTLDSAQNMLQEKKGGSADAKKVVVEGFDRAIKKIDDITNQLLDLNDSFAQKSKQPLNQLNEELLNLTFTESVFDLKIKIAKDRALQKSREFRKEVVNKIKNAVPYFISILKAGYLRSTQLYSKTKQLIGLEKTVTTIKGEVSNFLSETGEAINKLPFVYQRLFVVEPIKDERFFFGRENELEKLSNAFSKWSAGKFSPTIVFGEKGSGATSLINLFIRNNPTNYKLLRIAVNNTAQEKEEFLGLFSEKLGKSKNIEIQDLIQFLNSKNSGKKIIVLENLQHLFLRKINGFDNLKLLFELMSETNQNVFWVTTCTVYCYRYLQKTISISDYFSNIIELGNLTDQQIIDIIIKRHRVSGYDLYFEDSENMSSNKKFQKLSAEEKQIQLQKNYFSILNKFADSNISLALLFWVRSTSSISDDKINIGHLPKIDFSFLTALSNTKLFILNLLLIHDGLTDEGVSTINGISVNENRRTLITLEDDGILVRGNNLYLINPLLYRPVVEVLKSKNIIH